jgi:putative ABC transport system permease protein
VTTAHLSVAMRVRLALGDLRAEPLRTVLAVLVLTPIAASWFLLATIAGSLDTLGKTGEARNVVVTQPDVFDLSNIHLGTAELDAARAAAGDDAESVSPLIMRLVKLGGRVIQLRAQDPALWTPVGGLRLLDGRIPDPAADEMAITQAVRLATGWDVGDQERVFGTVLTVTAVLEGSGTKVASIWLPLTRAEALFERPGEFQMVVVRVKAGADGDAVRARLRAAMPGFLVLDESAIQAEATRGVRSLGDMARVFTAIGILGLAVGCANTTALTLAERTRSVGLLRVVGFTPRSVRGLLAMRAVLLTIAALVLGVAVAWPFIAARPSFVLRSFTIAPRLELLPTILGCLLSLTSAWVGAAIASRRVLASRAGSLLEA